MKIKNYAVLLLCVLMFVSASVPCVATDNKPVRIYSQEDYIQPEDIVPIDDITFNESAIPGYGTENQTRMGGGISMFTAYIYDMEGVVIATSCPKCCKKSDILHGVAYFCTNLTSSKKTNVKVGYARFDTNGNYVADCYSFHKTNSQVTSFPSTESMLSEPTYFGFVKGGSYDNKVSGTAIYGYLD